MRSESPADHVRLSMVGTLVFQEINSLACLEGSDEIVAQANAAEPTIAVRDFTGLDCTSWAYDLSNPDDPYEARGEHPSGVGVDRYGSWSDLTPEARELLTRLRAMCLLNALNPNLYGVNGIQMGEGVGMLSLSSMLTPYGHALELHALYRNTRRWSLDLGLGFNRDQLQPWLALGLRQPVGTRWTLGGQLRGWVQPTDLRWDATTRQPGGGATLEARWKAAERVDLRVAAEAKTAGWIMGEEALDPQVGMNAGAVFRVGSGSFQR
ncbi:MAG TPA: hypothetical protein QGF58_12775 [Myxococcota bacterium]|nr:hypothetical protein [Myxococcota bacterium]